MYQTEPLPFMQKDNKGIMGPYLQPCTLNPAGTKQNSSGQNNPGETIFKTGVSPELSKHSISIRTQAFESWRGFSDLLAVKCHLPLRTATQVHGNLPPKLQALDNIPAPQPSHAWGKFKLSDHCSFKRVQWRKQQKKNNRPKRGPWGGFHKG
ncbi:hypothetical protein BaRGS_00018564 [Batillaria attramentaria]|uniref:Uncharacterized protein n=1 Tax=Batillaria attramentaria TaxID=370345 RepID=A0ABD0KSK6_9CAEN